MKKLPVLVVALVFGFAANLPSQEKKEEKQPRHENEALYPLQVGHRWTYQVTDNKAKEGRPKKQQVVATVVRKDTFSMKVKDPKNLLLEMNQSYVSFALQVAPGGGADERKSLEEEVLVTEDCVYRTTGAGKTITPPLCILKRGVKKGDSWNVDSQSENAILKGRFFVDQETVQVPAGSFNALVTRCRDFQVSGQKMHIDAWYSAGVGLVKQRVVVGNHDVTLELEKHEAAK
jgi:hypothetical protein